MLSGLERLHYGATGWFSMFNRYTLLHSISFSDRGLILDSGHGRLQWRQDDALHMSMHIL